MYKKSIFILLFTGIFVICMKQGLIAQPGVITTPPDPEIVERGRQTFLQSCASCHGETGKGDGPLSDTLGVTVQDLSAHMIEHPEAQLFQMIVRGVGSAMPGFASELEMDEIIDLMDYLYTLEDSYQKAIAKANATTSQVVAQRETQTPESPENQPSEPSMDNMQMDDMSRCPSETQAGMANMQMNNFDPLDAVNFGRDIDGDGDPDEITVCLQVLDITEQIAPGIGVPFWVFAPDLGGMEPIARLPSPTLRFEQGDRVRIIVKNTHMFPHTLHMHGVIKPNEMDGIPNVTQDPIAPGDSFIYDFVAQNTGTYWYHCHVQPPVHILMGLYGMLVIEPNRPANNFTPLVMRNKMPDLSVATQEAGFEAEYMLTYSNVDPDLNAPVVDTSLSLPELEKKMHREYNSTERQARYFLLNGRSFPYTLIDSSIDLKPDQKVLLRVLNVGPEVISLHLHGHHAEIIASNGIDIPLSERKPMDTIDIAAGQRVDLELNTTADGIHASGPGVWLLHDHTEQAITTNGINPGGNLSYMVYEDYSDVYGLPKVTGDLSKYFNPDYYQGNDPVFDMAPFNVGFSSNALPSPTFWNNLPFWAWILITSFLGIVLGVGLTQVFVSVMRVFSKRRGSG